MSDSFGGGASSIMAFDSAEICHNRSTYGGAIGYVGAGGQFYCSSSGVRIHHNTATIGGGGIYGHCEITAGQIIFNQAPLGAAMWSHTCGPATIQNSYIYNPLSDGKRQNEVYVRSGFFNMEGSWFGKSDTIGLIQVGPTPCDPSNAIKGRYAKANWSANWGKPITKADTLFPIGAAFTYNDGTPLPLNSLPWLTGNFSSSTGKIFTPNPKMSPTDTMSSLFRTYVYPTKGDTSSKPINFTCIVDGDTFRSSPRVWGIDSIKLSIDGVPMATDIVVYPNPAKDFLNLRNVPDGSQLQLHSLDGKLLLSERSKGTNTVLDIAAFPVGHYLLKVIIADVKTGAVKVQKE